VTKQPEFVMRAIGFVRSQFKEAKDVPQGLGAEHPEEGEIVVLPEYAAGLADIEGMSHLYVLWVFDRVAESRLVVQPPCDGREHGVFATRSPRRPNPIGLTVVELMERKGNALRVRGIDMLDGTPVLDIKPYLSSIPPDKLRRGWLAEAEERTGKE
jgi:tRNA-Thr(GGU) m(6)t(6)A37 methyltransferase TsaA